MPVDGDGDGNAIGDAGDYDVWSTSAQAYLAFQVWQGDINRDGAVDWLDWAEWRKHVDETGDGLLWDLNNNDIVDPADAVMWANFRDSYSAWHLSNAGVFAGMVLVDSTSAPRVVNVMVSGSNSTHQPQSAGFGTVRVGGADTISIEFSEQVNVEASYLRVVGLRTFNVPTVAEFFYNASTMTATWRFDDLVANDHYLISLSDAVTDLSGYRLDGEYVNPPNSWGYYGCDFPSGDGHAGGSFNFVMTLLAADAVHDNIIDENDYEQWLANYTTSSAGVNEGDFNGDGTVDEADYAIFGALSGLDLRDLRVYGDLDGDFDVDEDDVLIFSARMGMSSPTLADGDFNFDGHVDTQDLELLFAQYGLKLSVAS